MRDEERVMKPEVTFSDFDFAASRVSRPAFRGF
jgi:hypothetical protein